MNWRLSAEVKFLLDEWGIIFVNESNVCMNQMFLLLLTGQSL